MPTPDPTPKPNAVTDSYRHDIRITGNARDGYLITCRDHECTTRIRHYDPVALEAMFVCDNGTPRRYVIEHVEHYTEEGDPNLVDPTGLNFALRSHAGARAHGADSYLRVWLWRPGGTAYLLHVRQTDAQGFDENGYGTATWQVDDDATGEVHVRLTVLVDGRA